MSDKKSFRKILLGFLAIGLVANYAWAESIELVTYYPTSANTGDQHTTSLTVGNNYLNTTLANGQALIQTSLGIGPGFTNNQPAAPTLLQVQGVAGQASQALFLPGAGGTMSLDVAGDLFVRQAAGSGNHVRIRGSSDANAAIELRSETLGGTPYIDFANDAATDADARIRLTGNDRLAIEGAELHIVQDQNAVVGSGLTNPNVGNLAVTDFRVGQDIATLGTQQYGSLRYWSQGTPANAFGFGNPNQVGLITGTGAVNGLTVATLANAPIKFLTNTAGVNNERMRITETGNVGVGNAYAPLTAASNGLNGNIDANDIFIRNGNRWASAGVPVAPGFDSGWFAVNINNRYTFNHTLGAIPRSIQMFFSPNATGTPAYHVGMMNNNFNNGYNVFMTAAQFKIFTGNFSVCVFRLDAAGFPTQAPNSGFYRFLAWA